MGNPIRIEYFITIGEIIDAIDHEFGSDRSKWLNLWVRLDPQEDTYELYIYIKKRGIIVSDVGIKTVDNLGWNNNEPRRIVIGGNTKLIYYRDITAATLEVINNALFEIARKESIDLDVNINISDAIKDFSKCVLMQF